MQMSDMRFDGEQAPIDGYAPGGFRIGGVFYDGSVALSPAGVASWPVARLEEADAAAAAALVAATAGAVDVVLFGSGAELHPAPAAFRAAVEAGGMGLEIMSSPSACRTYNVLLSEGRRVAAVLIAL